MLAQQKETWTLLWRNVQLATFDSAYAQPYGLIPNAAVAIAGERIAWCGPETALGDVPSEVTVVDGGGGCCTPGLIDCHSHLVFAGDRSDEFEKRLEGVSYAEIAGQGGGIQRTVTATREATEATLLRLAQQRLAAMEALGITSVEIKSGYGLDRPTELKLLRVIHALKQQHSSHIHRTFLGLHCLPPKSAAGETQRATEFVQYNCDVLLPEIKQLGLADSVDVFCESIGFTVPESERYFRAAQALGFGLKIHAEQLSHQGGARLAAQYRALSADHLEYLSEQDAAQMADAGVVAVLLPGAFYYLKESQLPPVHWLRQYGVPIALGSDFNPGTSPFVAPRLIMNLACLLFGLTVEEALAGMTRNAARAIGQGHCRGQVKAGYYADLCLWTVTSPAQLVSQLAVEPLRCRLYEGRRYEERRYEGRTQSGDNDVA